MIQVRLASEDQLRLNVLLANRPLAIRIDESAMTLHALLADDGEAQVRLHPNCRADAYLRGVREVLSGHVLGSPGGYPVFLQRWTRMGQARDESLEQLLLLGEPEAVVAVVCAPGLSDELARRAWWIDEEPESARRMLERPAVIGGAMGPRLAAFLVDYLPFMSETEEIVDSVRLVLQPGLLGQAARISLWQRGRRKPAIQIGFLRAGPDALPEPLAARRWGAADPAALARAAGAGNPLAVLLERLGSPTGQRFLAVLADQLERPSDQDALSQLFAAARDQLAPLRDGPAPDLDWPALEAGSEAVLATAAARELVALGVVPDDLRALHALAGLGYGVIRPLLGDSSAIGSLMRRKLEPVLGPIVMTLRRLVG